MHTQHATTITAVPGTPFLDVEREFDAAPDLVFRACTEPDLISQWLGPRRYEIHIDEMRAVSGGGYRFRHVDPDDPGREFAFRGVFHTVEPDRIIQTFEFEGAPHEVSLEMMTFTEVDGRTLLRARSVFPSVESLEGALASGMQDGMTESYDRLAELLARSSA